MQAKETIVVLDPGQNQYRELCSRLEKEPYRAVCLSSWGDLSRSLQEGSPCSLILDLDLVPLDNQTLRGLRRENLELCIIGLSSRSFHPELKEALSRHIDACFAKPVDWDDLLYYLKGALRNAGGKRTPLAGGLEGKGDDRPKGSTEL